MVQLLLHCAHFVLYLLVGAGYHLLGLPLTVVRPVGTLWIRRVLGLNLEVLFDVLGRPKVLLIKYFAQILLGRRLHFLYVVNYAVVLNGVPIGWRRSFLDPGCLLGRLLLLAWILLKHVGLHVIWPAGHCALRFLNLSLRWLALGFLSV